MTDGLMKTFGIFIFSLLLALLPVYALAEEAKSIPPPISQPLMTEGALAVQLVSALGISSTTDEVVAESNLGDIGIAPRNGWIAAYPVTPDIISEVQQSVAAVANAGKLSISRDEALKRFGDTIAGFDLTVRSYTSGESAMDTPVSCPTYPNPGMIITTYSNEGPPIVTYYCPPPDFYDLYDWVPYPFWWTDFWFPGFFILRDFHRHVFIHNHFVLFTNHFNNTNRHHVFRIDAVNRFHGKTFAGIGANPARDFISTGVQNSSQRIFNSSRRGNISAGHGGGGGSGGLHGGGGGGMHGGGGGRR
jgi:uncharacterized membrane protein YgcG